LNAAPPIGNDVVDLSEPSARGKWRHRRFLERVFALREQDAILASPEPDRILWSFWAAKEAAFKVARKRDARLCFAPRSLEVIATPPVPQHPSAGLVLTPQGPVRIRWTQAPTSLHAIGWEDDGGSEPPSFRAGVELLVGEEIDRRLHELTARELAQALSPASRAARLLVKHLLRESAAHEVEVLRSLEGDALGPPRLYVEGLRRDDIDVSLSHDGDFVAAAVSMSGLRIEDRG
jgi:phosphopantetheinyl transferase (holo-ACP synthase)